MTPIYEITRKQEDSKKEQQKKEKEKDKQTSNKIM